MNFLSWEGARLLGLISLRSSLIRHPVSPHFLISETYAKN